VPREKLLKRAAVMMAPVVGRGARGDSAGVEPEGWRDGDPPAIGFLAAVTSLGLSDPYSSWWRCSSRVQISYTPAGGGAPVTAGWDVRMNTSA
jgi:hypothetical protein